MRAIQAFSFVLAYAAFTGAPTALAAPTFPPEAYDRLARADSNGDGRVTRAEAKAFRARQFDLLDRNADGVLSDADRPPAALRGFAGMDLKSLLPAFDANGDGKVSRAEYENGPMPAFDAADRNHDGILDREELQAARAAARAGSR